MNNDIKLKEVQFFWWLLYTLAPVFVYITYSKTYHLGTKPIPNTAYLISILVFIVIALLFYKMTIEIDNQEMKITFGIGLIKKRFLLDKMENSKIEIVKTPWFYGMGIRFTPLGTLFNTQWGTAVKFGYKTSNYLIGTKNPNALLELLKKDT